MRTNMKFCIAFVLCSAVVSLAQTRTLTNADLAKYRTARENAEREYRENYERLGLPSPEELERKRQIEREETERVAARLRSDRLEKERLELARRLSSWTETRSPIYLINTGTDPGWAGVYYSVPRGRRYSNVRTARGTGYFAGGNFWPAPVPDQRLRPAFGRPRH